MRLSLLRKKIEPEDFCIVDSAPESRLSNFERLTLTGGADLERAFSWIAKQFTGFSERFKNNPFGNIDVAAAQRAAAFYSRPEWLEKPGQFFEAPGVPESVSEVLIHGLKDGEIVDISFASGFKSHNTEVLKGFELANENMQVHARWWRHQGTPRATIVGLHGWTMGDQRVNSLAFVPGYFYKQGYDVVLLELPFHGRRRPRNETGELFPNTDFARTNETMAQAISDVRQVRSYLEKHGRTKVGVIGLSLGAYLASLWSSLDILDFCVAVVPLVSMSDLAWQLLGKGDARRSLKRQGIDHMLLEKLYHLHCPLSHRLKIAPERSMIIAGLGDTMVPARQPKQLAEHWGKVHMRWYTGGHAAQFRRSDAFKEINKFLNNLERAEIEED